MEETDRLLLRRFTRQGDADAFSQLVNHYAGMVFSTCRRVVGNDAQAAEAAQETFFHLLKRADRVTESVGSWLHQVATRRAIEAVRRDQARRKREEVYTAEVWRRDDPWAEVEPIVDQALGEMPEELREVLVLHYLAGKSMTQIAAERGISQPTISRRIATGLEQLRQNLRKKGVAVSAAALAAMLGASAQAAPALMLETLAKMALAQAAIMGTGLAPAASLWTVAGKVALGAAALAVVGLTGWQWKAHSQPKAPPPALANAGAPASDDDSAATPVALQSANGGAGPASDERVIATDGPSPIGFPQPTPSVASLIPPPSVSETNWSVTYSWKSEDGAGPQNVSFGATMSVNAGGTVAPGVFPANLLPGHPGFGGPPFPPGTSGRGGAGGAGAGGFGGGGFGGIGMGGVGGGGGFSGGGGGGMIGVPQGLSTALGTTGRPNASTLARGGSQPGISVSNRSLPRGFSGAIGGGGGGAGAGGGGGVFIPTPGGSQSVGNFQGAKASTNAAARRNVP